MSNPHIALLTNFVKSSVETCDLIFYILPVALAQQTYSIHVKQLCVCCTYLNAYP